MGIAYNYGITAEPDRGNQPGAWASIEAGCALPWRRAGRPRLGRPARRAAGAQMEHSAVAALRVYLAHLILRQVERSIRHHDQPTIGYWLARAGQVLRDLVLR
jgi:hypothetical protein